MRINAGLILEANVPESKALMNIYKANVSQLIGAFSAMTFIKKFLLSHNSELRIGFKFFF